MSTYKNWSHLTVDYLEELHQQLGTWKAVGIHLGIDRSVLIAIRRRLGMQLWDYPDPKDRAHKPNRLDPHEETILRLASEGRNCYEIAEAIQEPSSEHVREFLKRRGVERQPAGPPRGHRNPAWNGGQTIDRDGYVLVRAPVDHPYARETGYILLHRLVMEEKFGRYLLPEEVVHHVDGNKLNNDPSNLMVLENNGAHLALEWSDPDWAEHQRAIRRINPVEDDSRQE